MKILHLEDEPALRQLYEVALKAVADVDVVNFSNGEKAMRHLTEDKNAKYTLFLLDVRVHGRFDGVAVAKYIRHLGYDVPIIINSAYQKPSKEVLEKYNLQWLAKPAGLIDLQQIIFEETRRKKREQS